MGRAQGATAENGCDAIMGRRRGARREFLCLDADLERRLRRVSTGTADDRWTVATLGEALERLAVARREGEPNDRRARDLAAVLARCQVGEVGHRVEFEVIDYVASHLGRRVPQKDIERAIRDASAALAKRLCEGDGIPWNQAPALFDMASLELRRAVAPRQAKIVISCEERALRKMLRLNSISYDSLKEQGLLEQKLSASEWTKVIMSCYQSFAASDGNNPADIYFAFIEHRRKGGIGGKPLTVPHD